MFLSFCYFQLLDASSQVKNQLKNSILRLDKIGLSAVLESKPFPSALGRLQFDPIFDFRDRHRSRLIRHKNHNFQPGSVYLPKLLFSIEKRKFLFYTNSLFHNFLRKSLFRHQKIIINRFGKFFRNQ